MKKLGNGAGIIVAFGSLLLLTQTATAADQPHMDETLRALHHAADEIQIADQYHDHGGHAGAATALIQKAIHEVQEGIRYRNAH